MDGQHIAVIGCGAWGANIVRTLRDLGALRAVVDSSVTGQARAHEIAPDVPVFDRSSPVLEDPEVKGVMIATPAETHYRLSRAALDAGKDVFVEKPFTVDADEARELIARAGARDRVLMVGHLLEYHPAVRTLLQLVRDGELGEVRYLVSNRLNLGRIRTEENALWSFAPHDIAVILRLVKSMPFEVVATGASFISPGIADVTVTQLRFQENLRAHIFVSWLHPFKEQRLVVVGSRKMASFDDVAKSLVLYDQHVDGPPGAPVPVRGEGVEVDFPREEPLRLECGHFLQCIETRQQPRTDGESGLRVLKILHASQQSLAANGQPMPLDAPPPLSGRGPVERHEEHAAAAVEDDEALEVHAPLRS